jgi:tol-pal system protein YbgF
MKPSNSFKGVQILKANLFLVMLVAVLALSGCATTDDVRRVRGELDHKIYVLEEKVKSLEEMKSVKETISVIQKSQAETGADITELKDHIQQLRGMVEGLRKDTSTVKDLKDKVDNIYFKVSFLENYLGIGKKEDVSEDKQGKHGNGSKTKRSGKSDKETAYETAYSAFKEGRYEKARSGFQSFLKQYPDSEYSGNAQFWIGECYYFENKFEKAIIEYEKVVKNHPDGNKVPNALLKQGLSFLKLGDKSSARLILQQVIKEYPNTNQARIARAKLTEIK